MQFPTSLLGLSRRELLAQSAHGVGLMALWQLMGQEGQLTASDQVGPGRTSFPHFTPRAKNVIFLFMPGGPSHVDLLDPKPQMAKWHDQPLPKTLLEGLADPVIRASATVMASPRTFRQYGQSGTEFCDLLPYTGSVADELCMIRSMHTDQANHTPAQLLLSCGTPLFSQPSFGSWVTYGLGSECADLPGYVVLMSNSGKGIDAGSALWSSGFMPSTHRGVTFRSSGDPILFLQNPPGMTVASQRARLNVLRELNELRQQATGDDKISARIASYELAFRMQSAAPDLLDVSDETEATLTAYGIGEKQTHAYGTNCLLARRMIERGVRFVQLFHSTWDDHDRINQNLATNCGMTDQPTAALIRDLRSRGLLDDTLVVWVGEFGRTPMSEFRRGKIAGKEGRDHHPFAFSMWLAGGGVKAGHVRGKTDDFGYHVTQGPVHVHDLQATILYLLGMDHEKLTYRHAGRDFRLTDVSGNVIQDVIA